MDSMTSLTQFQTLKTWLESQIIGQPALVERLLIALLAGQDFPPMMTYPGIALTIAATFVLQRSKLCSAKII